MRWVKTSGLHQAECRLSLVARVIVSCHLRRAPGYFPSRRTRTTSAGGQALIEFALVLPILLLLILNLVNFGTFIYAWITVANAARTGAQYMIMGGAWAASPSAASPGAVITLASDDAQWLPNKASLQVNVCKNNNGSVTCTGTNPGNIPNDPETVSGQPARYVLGTVDVTYTYLPMIPFWDFTNLGIHLTLPPTTIHRRTVMRMVQ